MRFAKLRLVFVCWFVVVVSVVACAEPLRLPKVFGDHMVLQRDLPVDIWGWADAGEKVVVSFGGQTKTTGADDDGCWRIKLSPLEASVKSATLKIVAGDETIEFSDVLVGEVWLCSGQSNMEWRVSQTTDAAATIAAANEPLIRHIEIDHIVLAEPANDVESRKGWEVCSPDAVGSFTAVGYFFGSQLHEKLNVPIGLVNSCWGGSNIESFTSLEGFKQVPELSDYVRRIENSLPDNTAYKAAVRDTMAKTKQWLKDAEKALAANERVAAAPALPAGVGPLLAWTDPANKHNAMIEGLAGYRVRGSIWYQGESNRHDGMLYVKKTEALVKGWRKAWGQPDLPYYYVQIAPYGYGDESPEVVAKFWEAQVLLKRRFLIRAWWLSAILVT